MRDNKETQMYRTYIWTLWEREKVGWFWRLALKHVYYHVRNESPVYVPYRIQDAWGWYTKMIQIDDTGWEVGGRFRIGNSCTPVADSCQCTAKPIQYCKAKIRRRQWHPTPVLLPGKSHGQRSLVGCSPWGRYESDTTEQLHFHFSLSCIGEGNGNPLQCSCLKNPRDGRAWWAAICGVAQSRTRLKWLSSSSQLE